MPITLALQTKNRTVPRQFTLDLGTDQNLCREDFLVSSCNEDALRWVENLPLHSAFALYGPEGCGKTHLAHIWQQRCSARFVTPERFCQRDLELIPPEGPLIFDGFDDIIPGDSALEQKLFHLYNLSHAQGISLLVTGRCAPARWPVALPDLKSRLSSLFAVQMMPPDDVLFENLLIKLCHDRQLRLSPEILNFLSRRCDRSFAMAHQIVRKIDNYALALQKPVTIPLVKKILEDLKQFIPQ